MQPRSAVVLYRKIWKTLPLKAQLCRLWRQRRGRQLLLALQPAERLVCRRRTRRIGSHGQQLQPGRSMGKHIVRLRRRAVRLQFQERTRHGLCRFRHAEIQHRHRKSFGRFRLLVVELGARLRRDAGVEFRPTSNLSLSLGVGFAQQGGRIDSDINSSLPPGATPLYFGGRR
jgi:hypothetical protein